MAFPVAQIPQDWLSQAANILLGRKVEPEADDWLLGPRGDIGGIADRFVEKLARSENLTIERNSADSGLIEGFDTFPQLKGRVDERITDFYRHTINYEFDVWSEWSGIFGGFGCLVFKLFTRRVQQLNLPQRALDTALGIDSEILILRDSTGARRYTIWFRRLRKTGDVIYSGVYSECVLPTGERCLKIIFPLPQGSATVVMRASATPEGHLELLSQGRSYDQPGFYFIVEDSKRQLWKSYLRSFHERIFVYLDKEQILRADHSMSVLGLPAYKLHYKMTERRRQVAFS